MRQLYEAPQEDIDPTHIVQNATVIKETKKAILVSAPSLDGEVWVPQSVVHDDSEVYRLSDPGPGNLVVKRWWAEERGWR